MIKKIDSRFRITIPIEIRQALNIQQFQEIDIYTEGNKIILDLDKSVSDLNLEPSSNKSDLQKTIEEMPYGNNYWKEETSIKQDDSQEEPKEELKICSKCKKELPISKMSNLKYNGGNICLSCLKELKKELIRDIAYKQRIDKLNK